MFDHKKNVELEGLTGTCFDSPPHELMATKHWIFSLLSFCRPETIQLYKWKLTYLLSLRRRPYARDRNNILFIHIPKNAGNSFCEAIFGRDRGRGLGHFSAQFFQAINPKQFESFLKVAVVRNPDQRFASAVSYNQNSSRVRANREFAQKYLDYPNLDELVSALDGDDCLYDKVIKHMHFRQQVGYVCDRHGRVIVDLLISMDALKSGLSEISKLVGHDFSLVHKNKSPSQRKGFQLTGRMRDYYEADFRLWDLVEQSAEGFIWVNEEKRAATYTKSSK